MKRTMRFSVFFCALLLAVLTALPAAAKGAEPALDVSTAGDGYFTVAYQAAANTKMKVGITKDGETQFLTYVPGEAASFAFTRGEGLYTVALYQNVSGTKYKAVARARVQVELENPMAPYLASTQEITFSPEDEVGKTAAALCQGYAQDGDKAAALYRSMAGSFTYDKELGQKAAAGKVVNYVPDTATTLESKTGICYDFSALYAAMCRSQGIPCTIVRGYRNGSYHAWNSVYVDGAWHSVDLTWAIANRDTQAATFADCLAPVTGYVAEE